MSNDQHRSCRCVKSNCVKLYCPCFSAYGYCSQNCRCTNCKNREYYEDFVEERVDMIKMKNPRAFDPKIVRVQDASEIEPQSSNAVPENEHGCMLMGADARSPSASYIRVNASSTR
ncbi:protein tesmin/TSO1-like CXC 4 [Oryza sativa Japonica Group]|uniref:protein tesmin/TSO1-like CXC 4 n=1 Tax=Oryza sativa subsp. japonica TaxID=39947 RepID=UPI000775447C|nr:protein tesmin/TSO1-like CXC 4 [Oryza sativa Japonica Group]XP_025880815.1 protein tesmin/TSO1-like CXC 4 [Oryza sativa Japonica Group]